MTAQARRDAAESAAWALRFPVDSLRPALRATVASERWVFDPALEERSAVPLEPPALGPAPECAEAALAALSPAVSLGQLASRSVGCG